MNITNRLKKLASNLNKTTVEEKVIWDFANTTTGQLHKLEQLIASDNLVEAQSYTAELLDNGFLSRRIIGREVL